MDRITYPYTLPELPTICPEDGVSLDGPGGLEGIESETLKLRACPECKALYAASAVAEPISGARIWSVSRYPLI